MALPKQSVDFPAWYQEVVKGAELAEMSFTRGSMVIRPYGFAIWEAMQAALDRRIKETGHSNLYFPLLIPHRLLEKEVEHLEGFAPEVAVVTHAGGEKLEETLVVRPTSETIIWPTYAKWMQSYRDLPFLYNQWCNVVRWELRPRLFLRTTEFLWQEGHTAHETEEEARAEQRRILDDVYSVTIEEDLAIPVVRGRKSRLQTFPGAEVSFTMEALMRDGKALQAGTSHYFGQNLSKVYDVKFLGRDGTQQLAYATSWGVTTRLVGALIMAHGDDKGLRIPPRLAPVQVVIVPIYASDEERSAVLQSAAKISSTLQGIRVKIDDREEHRPGYKFNEWELKGVPVRLEIGPKDLAKEQVVLYRRDTDEKAPVPIGEVDGRVPPLLDEIQRGLYEQAVAFRSEHTLSTTSLDELRSFISDPGGFVVARWCGRDVCEQRVKEETKADIRSLPLDRQEVDGVCVVCGEKATEIAHWAQAY